MADPIEMESVTKVQEENNNNTPQEGIAAASSTDVHQKEEEKKDNTNESASGSTNPTNVIAKAYIFLIFIHVVHVIIIGQRVEKQKDKKHQFLKNLKKKELAGLAVRGEHLLRLIRTTKLNRQQVLNISKKFTGIHNFLI